MIGNGQRAARICAAALLASIAGACRTSRATGPAAPASPARAVAAAQESRVLPLEEADPSRPVAIAVPMSPQVVVMPSGNAYLLLRAATEQRDGTASCDILYLAGGDAAELTRPDAQERLAASALELVAAFGPVAEAGSAGRLSVTAVFGRPGGTASAQRAWFARLPAGWRAEPNSTEHGVALVPPMALSAVRDRDEELGARRAAAAFISDADRADYDGAWAKTSALLKAVMSRVEFERVLAQRSRPSGGDDGDLYVAFSPPLERFLPGATVEAWLARETPAGAIVEALALRLDDDMEWRVACAVQLIRTPAPASPAMERTQPPSPSLAQSLQTREP